MKEAYKNFNAARPKQLFLQAQTSLTLTVYPTVH